MPAVQTISTSAKSGMKGWGLLMAITDPPKFRALLERNFRRALTAACLEVVAYIQEMIRTDEYAENAPLTVAQKRSSRPLIDKGDLVRAIAYQVQSPWKAEVGVKRVTKGGVNVAAVLHEGYTIDLKSPKYRKMRIFLAIMRKKLILAGKLGPGDVSKHGAPGFLVVPGRPFFARPFASQVTAKIVKESGKGALEATMKGKEYRHPAGFRQRILGGAV